MIKDITKMKDKELKSDAQEDQYDFQHFNLMPAVPSIRISHFH